jgi:nicotinamide-nucleotide amidase
VKAFVIAVGSELLEDDRLDTNSLRLAACFTRHGVELAGKSVVGDSIERIVSHLRHALTLAEVVVATGGLGPTTDDLTRQAVARCLGRDLVEDPTIVETIRARFAGFGMEMPEINRRQAMVVGGSRILANDQGTAPGLLVEHEGRRLFLLPGVPRELDHMIAAHLEPWLATHAPGAFFVTRSLRVACRSESAVEESIAPLYERFDPDEITVLAAPGDIEVRFTVRGEPGPAAERVGRMVAAAREVLGRSVYAEGRQASLEAIVGDLLRATRRTVVTAESCTGGLVAERLTAVPGSSDYFLGAAVTYSNELKQRLLGVSAVTLEAHGAVSAEVAREMAACARDRLGADYALSTTGIAGPGGGSAAKPVGTVHIGLAGPLPPDGGAPRDGPTRRPEPEPEPEQEQEQERGGVRGPGTGPGSASGAWIEERRLTLGGADRERIRRLTSQWALEMLRRRLLADRDPPDTSA